MVAAPSTGISSDDSSASRSIFTGRRVPRGLVFEKNTLIAEVTMCRCFEYGMYTRNERISATCAHRNP